MVLPLLAAIAGGIAIASAASYLLGQAGRAYESSRPEIKRAEQLMSQATPVAVSSPSSSSNLRSYWETRAAPDSYTKIPEGPTGPGSLGKDAEKYKAGVGGGYTKIPETPSTETTIQNEYVYADALKYAQEKEKEEMQKTPEIPVVSQVTRFVGFGPTRTGEVGQAIGIGKLLPEQVKELGLETKIIGGGFTERQTRAVKEYLQAKGLPQEQVSEGSYYIGQVGRYKAPFEFGQTLSSEVAGNVAGGLVARKLSDIPRIAAIKNTTLKSSLLGGLGSFGGAFAEASGQTTAEMQKTGDTNPMNYVSGTLAGGTIGGILSAPIGAGITAGKTIQKTSGTTSGRIAGSILGKTSDVAGQALDPFAETFGDITTSAGMKVKARVLASGISATRTFAEQQARTQETTQAKTSTIASTRTFSPVTSFFNSMPASPSVTPTPNKQTPPVQAPSLAALPTPEKQQQPEQQPMFVFTQEPVKTITPTPTRGVFTRSIVPNRANKLGSFFNLPIFGAGVAATAFARKRYYNELQGLKFLNFRTQKRIFEKSSKIAVGWQPKKRKTRRAFRL